MLEVQNVVVILGDHTLGAREFSCVVNCCFGQVFIVIYPPKMPLDSALIALSQSQARFGPDFGHDG